MPTYIVEFGTGFIDNGEIVQTETLDIAYCDSVDCMRRVLSGDGWNVDDLEPAGQRFNRNPAMSAYADTDYGQIVSWGRVYCPETSSDEYCPHCGEQVTTGVNGE
jgi:hypothetical protein